MLSASSIVSTNNINRNSSLHLYSAQCAIALPLKIRKESAQKGAGKRKMRVFFDYPLATEENMKAIQEAINSGKDEYDLAEMFGENTIWDCVAVLSGNKDTCWALLDHLDGHVQTSTEDWQFEIVSEYIAIQQLGMRPSFDDNLVSELLD